MRARAKIGSDGVDHLCRYPGSRPEFYAAASWLPVDTHTDLHLVLGDVECRLAGRRNRAARQRDPDRARGRIDAITQELQGSEIASLFGGRAYDFLHDKRAGNTSPSRRKSRGLHPDT